MVSPRKSRRKSACFSSTTTLTPARANRKPSLPPAGPPPAMAHFVLIDKSGMHVICARCLSGTRGKPGFRRSVRQRPHISAARGVLKGLPLSPPAIMRVSLILALFFALMPLDAAFAQLAGTGNFHIVWEAKNRFRLFRNEADFVRQAAANRGDGVLAAEQRLERDTDGLGWAKDVVPNLCLDKSGGLLDPCERGGGRENYLAPRDHPVGVMISGPLPPGANCVWNFDDGDGPVKQNTAPCD